MQRGFSLVELSIVLVILGLLTGGILAGQSLIRAAELRKVGTQYDQIRTAVNSFRQKYMALPGDMGNATDFWGTADDCFAANTTTQTCNGNGSGRLAYVSLTDTSNVEYEPWHFWKQLANAGLIPGSYNGASATPCAQTNYCMVPEVNTLAGPYVSSGWMAFSVATTTDRSWQGKATNRDRNILSLGNHRYASGQWIGASLSAVDQWNLDQKIDDGMPYTGILVDISGTSAVYTPNCASANSNEFGNNPPGTVTNSATYLLDRTTVSATEGCLPFFDL